MRIYSMASFSQCFLNSFYGLAIALLICSENIRIRANAYYVLMRYNNPALQDTRFLDKIFSKNELGFASALNPTLQATRPNTNINSEAYENESPEFIWEQKRSAANMKHLPKHEHVCNTVIRNDYRPNVGHEQNGTRIEIQQDDRRQFMATFVECESIKREQCHGIDNILFTSECVTLYEFRPAGVRLEGSTADFVEGYVRIPITCQCRLRRKLHGILKS